MTRYLLKEIKLSAEVCNKFGPVPLKVCIAALKGHKDILQFLITEFNCNPYVRGVNGWTLLHYVCKEGHTELVDDLITGHGLDPAAKDANGNSPLHIAAIEGHIELSKILILL